MEKILIMHIFRNSGPRFFLLAIFIASFIFSCKKETTSNNDTFLNETDKNFILKVSAYDSAEIRTAEVALNKVDSVYMIAFAQSMLSEHLKAKKDLKTMGNVTGFSVKDTISPQSKSQIANLDALPKLIFDSTYLVTRLLNRSIVTDMYIDEINNGNHKNLKNYAGYYLEIVRYQINRADSIRAAYFP